MKKNFSFLFCMIFFPAITSSQIPNPGFESWTNGIPNGWRASNPNPSYISSSTTAHSGLYSARGDIVNYSGKPTCGWFMPGQNEDIGFPINIRNASASGFYQFHPVGGDRFVVVVDMYKGNPNAPNSQVIGAGILYDSLTSNSWKQFNLPISYTSSDTPDTCVISFLIYGPSSTDPLSGQHLGTYFLVDDLTLGSATEATPEINVTPSVFNLEQNYPNPFNPSTVIEYSLIQSSHITLRIFDITGACIKTLLSSYQQAGVHQIPWDGHSETGMPVPSGIYFYSLNANNGTITKKMLLLR